LIDDLSYAEESIMAPRTPKDPAKAPAQPKPAAKPAAKAAGAEKAARPAPKGGAKPANPASGLKLRDLIDSVATATGAKKSDAKITVEATLAALATALKSGADMTLPPLGKLRVVKLAEKNGATMMTLKLRHGGGQNPGAKPLAEDGEDG
jgi:nucleoid DNA-binding protein